MKRILLLSVHQDIGQFVFSPAADGNDTSAASSDKWFWRIVGVSEALDTISSQNEVDFHRCSALESLSTKDVSSLHSFTMIGVYF